MTFGFLIGVWCVPACVNSGEGGEQVNQQETPIAAMTIEEAQKQLTDSLMFEPGVAGIGIGECDGTPCIKVYVVQKSPELMDKIPETIGGYEVTVQETGAIEARE